MQATSGESGSRVTSASSRSSASFHFGPDARIKKRIDFEQTQKRGLKHFSKHFLILYLQTDRNQSRLGLTVTVKVEKRAAMRNRLKRRLRDIFRLNRHRLKQTFDIVIIARKNATACNYSEIRREVLGALFHAQLLREKPA